MTETEKKIDPFGDPAEEVELKDQKVDGQNQAADGQNKSKKSKSVLSSMKESSKAAEMYTYDVTPNFFKGAVDLSQTQRPTNKRKSTRYTWPTFFPIAFGLQFKKLVNIFYLVTGVINFFPEIQVNSPFAVLIPTFLIMLLGVSKEFVGELKRYKEDKQVNATPVERLDLANRSGDKVTWEKTCLAEVKVGDILKISDNEQVPADCVLLKVEGDKPECFVKTAALDGERNLKPKLANPEVAEAFDALFGPKAQQERAGLSISCIPPTKELYYFEGRLRASLPDEENFRMNLDLNQFLHRGSYIENSGSVYALVVYTGTESKLILNLGKYVYKMSSFEKILNRIMVINLLLAIFIAFVTAFVAVAFSDRNSDEHWYAYDKYDSKNQYIIAFFRIYLIVNSFVPLDLLAMLEISKLLFTPIMQNDTEMMIADPVYPDPVGFKANTLNLAEELGQVEYIFCDKTGTLTQNELVFREMVLQKGQHLKFADKKEIEAMQGSLDALSLPAGEKSTLEYFFRCVNLCHDCIALADDKTKKLVYNGPSVDEVCLLEMSADTGISSFVSRDSDIVEMKLGDQVEGYAVIKIFPFTSERKAMSVVLKHPTQDKAICYVKGADSSVFPMCNGYGGVGKDSGFLNANDPNGKILEVEKKVEAMAKKGLRTLLYGMKEIEWDGTRDPLDLPVEEIECDLTLLAATGVEDLLQDRVKECIEDFRAAGISVWMLTGDKGLTALEIGVSCGLIPPDHQDIGDPIATVQGGLETQQNIIQDTTGNQTGLKVLMFEDDDTDATRLFEKIKRFITQVEAEKSYQILISGMVIAVALDNEFMHKELGQLLLRASSVIVYRSSPYQKAQVVTFMKKYTKGKVTLAIGDGANDVNMIQSADLGFGLMGKEGNQAAAFADYAIPRYKDLRRALLWHGRGYGWRVQYFTIMVLAKSIVNAIGKYGVTFTNGASGLQPVDDLLITGFNILMTNWFVLHYCVYDQEVSFKDYGTIEKEKLLPFTMAELYAYTRKFINKKRFLVLVVIMNIYSIIAGFVIWLVWDQYERSYPMKEDGKLLDLYSYGVFLTMTVVIAHHWHVAMNTRNWGVYLTGWALFSISMLPFTLWLSQNFFVNLTWIYKSTYVTILTHPLIWIMVLLTVILITLPMFAQKKWLQVVRYPKFYQV